MTTTDTRNQVNFGRGWADERITVFRARTEWYVPSDTGGAYTGWASCEHDHRTPEAAEACLGRLEAAVRRNPAKYGVPNSDGTQR